MALSRSVRNGAFGVTLGMGMRAVPTVEAAATFTVGSGDADTPLVFQVWDRSRTNFLGTLTRFESRPEWSEELNAPGSGRLKVHLSDPAIKANPAILNDDNIVVAKMYGKEVFAWRVATGEDNLISDNEEGGEYVDFSGPGVLSALSEAIVMPEYSNLESDPTRENRDRFFGYMSLVPSQASRPATSLVDENLITKPHFTTGNDWEQIEGTTGVWNLSVDNSITIPGWVHPTMEVTRALAVAARAAYVYNGAEPIAVTPGEEISLAMRFRTTVATGVQLFADFFEVGQVNGASSTLAVSTGLWTRREMSKITVPEGASQMRIGFRLTTNSVQTPAPVLRVGQPFVIRGDVFPDFFSGDSVDTDDWRFDWTGPVNGSTSTRRFRGQVTESLQPRWYDSTEWGKPVYAFRKSDAAKSGKSMTQSEIAAATTLVFSPEGWADPTAYGIWSSDPRLPSAPGTVYFRKTITMTQSRNVFLQAAADNRLRVWIDGVEVITEGFNGDATDIVGSWEGYLTKGEHLIAAEVTNFNSSNFRTNYGWFLCTLMFKVGNDPVGVIAHTDKSWNAFYKGNSAVSVTYMTETTTKDTTTEKKVPVTYTVRSGDTLTAIGQRYGIPWKDIYYANQKLIDDRAAASGLPNNGAGWWIFPGQVLTIPGKFTTTTTGSKTTVTITTPIYKEGTALKTERPGWLPYQILAHLVQEGKNRNVNALKKVTFGFSHGYDSERAKFLSGYEAIVQKSFSIGTDLLSVAQELTETGMDVRMMPDMTLNAYREMGKYRGLNAKPKVRFRLLDKGGTTLSYKVKKRTDLYNFFLINTDQGWQRYKAADVDERGRSEVSASLGGLDAEDVDKAIGEELNEMAKRTKTVTTKFLIVSGRRPYIDFDLGDVVICHDNRGRPFDARITGIGVSDDGEGTYVCEVSASGEEVD